MNSLVGQVKRRAVKTILGSIRRRSKATGSDRGVEALHIAYAGAMERINSQSESCRELAYQVLSWIMFARRPLSTGEIQYACTIEDGDRKLEKEDLVGIEDMIFAVLVLSFVVDGQTLSASSTIRQRNTWITLGKFGFLTRKAVSLERALRTSCSTTSNQAPLMLHGPMISMSDYNCTPFITMRPETRGITRASLQLKRRKCLWRGS